MANYPFHGLRWALIAAKSSSVVTPVSLSTSPTKKPSINFFLLRRVQVSSVLARFLGVPQISRAAAVKKIWEYAKLHNLQNPDNRREILCDIRLKSIFNDKEKVGFGEIAKLLSTHFVKPNNSSCSNPN